MKIILSVLSKDYFVPEPQILNAKDFGLPQNRQRIFIAGFRKDLGIRNFNYPNKLKEIKDQRYIEKKVDKKYIISERLWASHQARKERNKKGNGLVILYLMVMKVIQGYFRKI